MAGEELIGVNLATPLVSAITTNPSSATLALVGLVSWLSYQVIVRPGHANRPRVRHSTSIKPRRTDTRIQPRRRVA